MIEYRKLLLKLSGRFLEDDVYLKNLSSIIKTLLNRGKKISILVGGGNILRGRDFADTGEKRKIADIMGMYATVINGLFITGILKDQGIDTVHLSALNGRYTEPYEPSKAQKYMEKNVVVLSGGTGSPFFTTDTAAVLRSCEMGVDLMIKGTDVEGVYTGDPKTDRGIKKLDRITYKEVVEMELRVMDLTAVTLAWEFSLPIVVMRMDPPDNLLKFLEGENVGTFIGGEYGTERS